MILNFLSTITNARRIVAHWAECVIPGHWKWVRISSGVMLQPITKTTINFNKILDFGEKNDFFSANSLNTHINIFHIIYLLKPVATPTYGREVEIHRKCDNMAATLAHI